MLRKLFNLLATLFLMVVIAGAAIVLTIPSEFLVQTQNTVADANWNGEFYITFQGDNGGYWNVYKVSAEGKAMVIFNTDKETYLKLSEDGRRIVFTRPSLSGGDEVCYKDISKPALYPASCLRPNATDFHRRSASMTQNGKVLYESFAVMDNKQCIAVWDTTANSTKPIILDQYRYNPMWSANGDYFVVQVGETHSNEPGIEIYSADGNLITYIPGAFEPSWATVIDERLAYVSGTSINIYDISEKEIVYTIETDEDPQNIVWSPDESTILYTSFSGITDLKLVDLTSDRIIKIGSTTTRANKIDTYGPAFFYENGIVATVNEFFVDSMQSNNSIQYFFPSTTP